MMRVMLLGVTYVALLFATTEHVQASLTLFTGADPTATSLATGPNSTAAEAAFLSAVGPVQTTGFESLGLPNGDIGALTLTSSQLGVSSLTITAIDGTSPPDIGLNSVSGVFGVGFGVRGSNYLAFAENGSGEPSAELQFNFADPIGAFGLFLSGGDFNLSGSGLPTIVAGGDTINVVKHGSATTGLQFIGFTSDTPLTQVRLLIDPQSGDNSFGFGIDEVSFAPFQSSAAIPEPTSLALMGLAASFTGIGAARRRRRERKEQAQDTVA